VDFVSVLTYPLGSWQAGNWEEGEGGGRFERFCEALSGDDLSDLDDSQEEGVLMEILKEMDSGPDPRKELRSFGNYQAWIKTNIASLCPPEESQDDCFGTNNPAQYESTSIQDSSWRSWSYQVCTEWGYFMGSPPSNQPSLVSRLITPSHYSKMCPLAFPPSPDGKHTIPPTPEINKINSYGDFELHHTRLAFIDGDMDPWLYATPHSPLAQGRESTVQEPFLLINGGRHHYDENGYKNRSAEPLEIQEIHRKEIGFVKSWLAEWREELEAKKQKERWTSMDD